MSRLKRIFGAGLFVALLSISVSASAAGKLYAILAADTTDESIGDSTEVDLNNMKQELESFKKSTGLEFEKVILSGRSNVSDRLWKAIRNLDVQPEDVVLFYYSGHGFRTREKDPNPWPFIYFNLDDSWLDYADIIKELKGKNPKLLVTMVDVCNSYIDGVRSPIQKSAEVLPKAVQDKIKKSYLQLFLHNTGSVTVTSSSTGEYSYGSDAGGMYTVAFEKMLSDELRNCSDPTWQHILSKTKRSISDDEHPYFEVDVETD